MTEDFNVSDEYIKAYNQGYLLKMHDPQLLEKLLTGINSNNYLNALRAGAQQHDIEKVKQLSKDRQSNIDRER